MKNKKKYILITGGSGFLAHNLALRFQKKFNVVLFSRNLDNLKKIALQTNSQYFAGDITRIDSLRDVFNSYKFDSVIHTAASKYVDHSEINPNECVDINFLGTQNLVRSCINYKVKKLIAISSDKAASPHNNLYSLSKTFLERYISLNSKISDTKMCCVRFGNIAWSTGSVFPIWKSMTEKNNIIFTTGYNMHRYFFSVAEASDLINYAITNINLLNGKILIQKMKQSKIKDILNLWIEIYKSKWKKVKKRPGDKNHETLIAQNEIDQVTKIIKKNKKTYYVIDLNASNKKLITNKISTENSEKLNTTELSNLIKIEN